MTRSITGRRFAIVGARAFGVLFLYSVDFLRAVDQNPRRAFGGIGHDLFADQPLAQLLQLLDEALAKLGDMIGAVAFIGVRPLSLARQGREIEVGQLPLAGDDA